MDYNLWKIPKKLFDELTKYQGQIVTRFPPEPSGYLHVGHLKACFINYVIAKKFNGQFVLRFDDTNPLKESVEFEHSIVDDLNKFSIAPDKITHSSDHFDKIIELAEYLIQSNLAYVDNLDQNTIKEHRSKGIESPNRTNSVELNSKIWNDMKEGLNNNYCLRLKIDMNHKNYTCRDPTIFRYLKTDCKYNVFPTYDFCCPIVDYLEGITHVFRSGFNERDEQYRIILNMLGIKVPYLDSYGKLNFENCPMGKRKIKELVERGVISEWSDPRVLTISGLFNRGMSSIGLIHFIAKIGFSKNTTLMTQDAMWSINKKYIDSMATRYMVVPKNNIIELNIDNQENYKCVPKYVKNIDLGHRVLYFDNQILLCKNEVSNIMENEEITLINWGNAVFKNGTMELHLEGSWKTTKSKLLWISLNKKISVFITSYTDINNPPTIKEYYGEYEMINLKKGDYVQLLKMGYYQCTENGVDYVNLVELPYC